MSSIDSEITIPHLTNNQTCLDGNLINTGQSTVLVIHNKSGLSQEWNETITEIIINTIYSKANFEVNASWDYEIGYRNRLPNTTGKGIIESHKQYLNEFKGKGDWQLYVSRFPCSRLYT